MRISRSTLAGRTLPTILAGTLAALGPAEAAVTSDFFVSQDATIYEESDTTANGMGAYFFAGNNDAAETRRGIVQFDLSAIPAGSTITSATLTLTMSRTQAGSVNVGLHRTLTAWNEGPTDPGGQEGKGRAASTGDVTWRYTNYNESDPPLSGFWSILGGDFVAGASAVTSVGGNGNYLWSSAAMVADIQLWVDFPAMNHGWFVLGGETGQKQAKRFNSVDNNDTTTHPVLSITYDPPSGMTGACCQLGGDICTQETTDDCINVVGGTFQGIGTPCTAGLCADPVGACCDPLGACSDETQLDCSGVGGAYQGDTSMCSMTQCPVVLEPYVDELPIPRVAQPTSGTSGGAATYDIVMQEVQQQLHRDLPSVTVWGYGDDPNTVSASYPGPTVEVATGQPVVMRHHNDLRDTSAGSTLRTEHYLDVDTCSHGADDQSARTVVHLHGGHVGQESDGYPEATFLPGEEAAYCVTEPTAWCMTDAQCPAPSTCDGDGAACTSDADCVGHGGSENCLLCETGYLYPNNQDASTLWFHDHALGITRLNVYMGLASFYLVRDTVEQGLGLPGPAPQLGDPPGTTYYEIPIVIQDRTFKGNPVDGYELDYPVGWQENFFGDTAVVNGKVWPYLDVDQGKYRLRLLNGSNSRRYVISLDRLDIPGTEDVPFHVIGADGGLLPAPVETTQLVMGPAERYDVIVDFACADPPACTSPIPSGTEIVIRNTGFVPGPDIPELMKFVVGSQPGFTGPIPASLRPMQNLDPNDVSRTRQFLLRKGDDPCTGEAWEIRSRSEAGVDVGTKWVDITDFPQLGTTEIWEFANPTVVPHPMHMHLVFFQILNREDFQLIDDQIVPSGNPVPPAPEESGWKDTARTEPGQILRVIVRFTDYEGLYAYHCHILEHEDHEMMRQFRTVEGVELSLDDTDVTWPPVPGATGYDIVRGDLEALFGTGDFAASTQTCLVNGLLVGSTSHGGTPPPGGGYWYLGRTRDPIGKGTYNSGFSSQWTLRDDPIGLSGNGCN